VSDEVKFPSYIDVTDSAKDFILKIMEKNPVNRVEIEALLHHPFLK
jgi:serine/threonine protein kinase